MLGTRPDIAFVVIKMSQFSSNPMEEHLQKVLYIVRYLSSFQDLCISYSGHGDQNGLCAYSDTDWAGDIETSRSTTVTEIPFVDESSEQELLSLLGNWYEPKSIESVFSSMPSDAVFFSS